MDAARTVIASPATGAHSTKLYLHKKTTLDKFILKSPALSHYVESHARDPHPYLATIRAHCLEHKWSFMLTSNDQAAFLYSHAHMIQARKILEVGVFYGHSTLALAAALPADGKLYAIEHNPKFSAVARKHMADAGVSERVEILTGEAPLVLGELSSTQAPNTFDLAFVDADKRHFELYWEHVLHFLRPGGVAIFDNVLARGEIVEANQEPSSHIRSVQAFNDMVRHDPRVFSYIASVGDGMMVAIKQ